MATNGRGDAVTFIPTTTVKILRGTATNYAGDEVDDEDQGDAVASDVPMHLTEKARRATRAADLNARTVRYVKGLCLVDVDVRAQDRLVDQGSGAVFLVEAVRTPVGQRLLPVKTLELQQVS